MLFKTQQTASSSSSWSSLQESNCSYDICFQKTHPLSSELRKEMHPSPKMTIPTPLGSGHPRSGVYFCSWVHFPAGAPFISLILILFFFLRSCKMLSLCKTLKAKSSALDSHFSIPTCIQINFKRLSERLLVHEYITKTQDQSFSCLVLSIANGLQVSSSSWHDPCMSLLSSKSRSAKTLHDALHCAPV